MRPSGGGADPVDDAGERRIPQGSFLRESRCQVWPAAIRPQTPAMPRPKRAPDFRYYGGEPSDTLAIAAHHLHAKYIC